MQRTWIPLSHDWRFLRADAPDAWQPGFDDSSWDTVSLPHTFNAEDTFIPTRGYYRGPAWYRLRLPQVPAGARVELAALGAFAVTSVWLNGAFLGEFMGGFTGFSVNLTPHLQAAAENVLALRVTNEHDPEVLPGKDIPDYNLYGGIYREIGLRLTDPLHIPDRGIILNTPKVSEGCGETELSVLVRNDRPQAARGLVVVTITGPDGQPASNGQCDFEVAPRAETTAAVSLPPVKNPRLWSPDSPHLYTASVEVKDASGVIDAQPLTFGFRWYEFDADRGFFLNGKRLQLRGLNRHQDYPGIGNALPASFQAYDAQLTKEMGGNFVRCSHYPMHPAFLDACDRLGILVYEEIASWQHIGGPRFADNAVVMMEQMIARDRHHPSIILWGLLNEGRDAALFRRLNETAHRCDPYRLTIYAENHPEKGIALGTVGIPDVLGINYLVERIDEVRAMLPGLRLLSSEHTNADVSDSGDLEKELYQLARVLNDLDRFEAREWLAGTALWSMHDYGTDLDVVWPLQKSGVFDAWRFPKAAALAIRARWSNQPFIHLVGHWTRTGLKNGDAHFEPFLTWMLSDSPDKAPLHPGLRQAFTTALARLKPESVFVICDQSAVELFLNGKSLGRCSASEGFVWQVPYEPGVLRAVARTADGREISDERRTAKPTGSTGAIRLETLHPELPANGTDITLVTATIVDEDGTPVPEAVRPVSFRAYLDGKEGGATFFGVGGVPGVVTRAGRGRIVLRAGRTPGTLRLIAESPALQDGETTMTLLPA